MERISHFCDSSLFEPASCLNDMANALTGLPDILFSLSGVSEGLMGRVGGAFLRVLEAFGAEGWVSQARLVFARKDRQTDEATELPSSGTIRISTMPHSTPLEEIDGNRRTRNLHNHKKQIYVDESETQMPTGEEANIIEDDEL